PDELGSANMEAPRVRVVGKTNRNRDRFASPLRVHKKEHSVAYCPDVIFTLSHRLQFQNLYRHKALIVAPIIEFALTLAVKERDDDVKSLEIVGANGSRILASFDSKWLAVACFDHIFRLP